MNDAEVVIDVLDVRHCQTIGARPIARTCFAWLGASVLTLKTNTGSSVQSETSNIAIVSARK